MTRTFVFLIWCVLTCGWANALQKPVLETSVRFLDTSATVAPLSWQHIERTLNQIKVREWCAFEGAYVVVQGKGRDDHALALARARGVRLRMLLETLGVPTRIVHVEITNSESLDHEKDANIEFVGGIWPKPCPYPLSPAGFHILSRPSHGDSEL